MTTEATVTALAELVAVMDRLRSPGGCPWDAEQTHQSLVPYAIEEVFEVAEAVESGDRDHLREELGDLLLQVVFQARVAAEDATQPFDLADVAAGITAKLRSRHPHVFADTSVADAAAVSLQWDHLKALEKSRGSVLDGVPVHLPALARAQKVLGRARRADLTPGPTPMTDDAPDDPDRDLGERLLALVVEADRDHLDAEGALRRAVRRLERAVRSREAQHVD